MRIGLITARHTVALDVAHHAIAGWYHRWSECLLQLLLLLAVFGSAILEPDLFWIGTQTIVLFMLNNERKCGTLSSYIRFNKFKKKMQNLDEIKVHQTPILC